MNKIRLIALMIILLLPAACGPSQEELDATATQIAANIFATQTAEAPTHTPTPLPTDTPTATPTPTNTPTATPTATDTPTPTPTDTPTPTPTPAPAAEIDLDSITLTVEDVGPGFVDFPLEALGLSEDELIFGDTQFDGAFVLADSNFSFYMGLVLVFDDEVEELGFDFIISNPDFLGEAFATGFAGETDQELETVPLTGLEEIGEAASGVATSTEFEGLPATIEVIAFRRGQVGALVMTIALSGSELALSTADAARLLDAKIIAAGDSG